MKASIIFTVVRARGDQPRLGIRFPVELFSRLSGQRATVTGSIEDGLRISLSKAGRYKITTASQQQKPRAPFFYVWISEATKKNIGLGAKWSVDADAEWNGNDAEFRVPPYQAVENAPKFPLRPLRRPPSKPEERQEDGISISHLAGVIAGIRAGAVEIDIANGVVVGIMITAPKKH